MGGYRFSDGGWQMADFGWRIADTGYRMADFDPSFQLMAQVTNLRYWGGVILTGVECIYCLNVRIEPEGLFPQTLVPIFRFSGNRYLVSSL